MNEGLNKEIDGIAVRKSCAAVCIIHSPSSGLKTRAASALR